MPETRLVPGTVARDPAGYVEPSPWLFARLAGLCDRMRTGLAARDLLDPDLARRLGDLGTLLVEPKTIGELELVGAGLTDEQEATIRYIAGALASLSHVEAEAPRTDRQIAVVADVHGVPMAGPALEEGVGDAFEIDVVVPEPGGRHGEQTPMRGGVFSYYGLPWPMAERLTDEAWPAMDPKPAQPDWTASYIVVDRAGRHRSTFAAGTCR